MESLSRLQLYSSMLTSPVYSNRFKIALQVNICILTNVEPIFLSSDSQTGSREDRVLLMREFLLNNINELKNKKIDNKEIKDLGAKLMTLLDEKTSKGIKPPNLFNRVIKSLADFNEKMVLRSELPPYCMTRSEKVQVFLSHAYDDKLYTGALFEWFYGKGIFLYVDWMHHDKLEDGKLLKYDLEKELEDSSQLLYLRTPNSELNIQGKQQLRAWCAWELGNFFGKDGTQKYMINLYSSKENEYSNNILLHGIKQLTGVNKGLLEGVEITYQKEEGVYGK